MNLNTYLRAEEDFLFFKELGIQEVILEHKHLSRFGELESDDLIVLLEKARTLGLSPVLEWDLLMGEAHFLLAKKVLETLPLNLFDAIRVQDPGAFHYLIKYFPTLPLHLILETGNHNWQGISEWCDLGGSQLKRVVLSSEIPREKLSEYINKLKIPVETLGLGRLLVFYSPRKLLSPLALKNDEYEQERVRLEECKELYASSEESPHKGFPIFENKHGTFMFHTKELCLLEFLKDLKEMNLNYLRLDFRFYTEGREKICPILRDIFKNFSSESIKIFKQEYSSEVTRGYFSVNKTDVLFKKLKNIHIQRKDENFVGIIIEVCKYHYLALQIRNVKIKFEVNTLVEIKNTEGKVIHSKVGEIRNIFGEKIDQANDEEIVLIPYIKGADMKSAVYLKEMP